MSSIELSIIIVSYNTKELLRDCLKSIDDGYPVDTRRYIIETVVVDNGSTDGSVEMIKKTITKRSQSSVASLKSPVIKLIESKKNLGFSKACNLGAKNSKGEFLLFLNPDTKVCPKSLEKMVLFLKNHSRAGIVGPQLLNEDGSFQPSVGVYPSLSSLILEKPVDFLERRFGEKIHPLLGYLSIKWRRFEKPARVDWVCGAALMCRRGVFDKIGGFDESFFMYFEEVDFCLRAKGADWEVYFLPQAKIYHLRGKSQPAKSRQKAKVYYRSQDCFFEKHKGKLYSTLVKIVRLPYQVLDARSKVGRYY